MAAVTDDASTPDRTPADVLDALGMDSPETAAAPAPHVPTKRPSGFMSLLNMWLEDVNKF